MRQAFILSCLGAAALAGAAVAAPCVLEPGPTRAVVKVIDGETLALDDGSEVRLIGALTPRSPDAGAAISFWPPEQEARAALEAAALGKSVDLAFARGARTDRYQRHLAHVFVHTSEGRAWLQGHMLEAGHARAHALPGHAGCMDELIAHEQLAREKVSGLWKSAAYAIRQASRTRELLALRSTFQIVEGRVRSASEVRGRHFLNFGTDWRDDFTIVVKSGEARALATRGIAPNELAGRTVRVRGWLERRGGPMIEIADGRDLEVVEEAEQPAPAADTAPSRKGSRPAAGQPASRSSEL
jgi:endonuclease YncB( thermonuclease family)